MPPNGVMGLNDRNRAGVIPGSGSDEESYSPLLRLGITKCKSILLSRLPIRNQRCNSLNPNTQYLIASLLRRLCRINYFLLQLCRNLIIMGEFHGENSAAAGHGAQVRGV